MIILGISPLDKDSTVTLMKDGKVLFAAGEERFTRNKLQSGFPAEALQAGLRYTGISIADIDLVAYPFFDWKKETQLFTRNLKDETAFLDEAPVDGIQRQVDAALANVPNNRPVVPGLTDPNEKLEKSLVHRMLYKLVGPRGRAVEKYRQTLLSRLEARRHDVSQGMARRSGRKSRGVGPQSKTPPIRSPPLSFGRRLFCQWISKGAHHHARWLWIRPSRLRLHWRRHQNPPHPWT